MAIQQLYGREHMYPSWQQSLGSGLGGGLALLAQHKANEITQQKRAREWENIGLPSNVAQFLVSQPESIQKEFLDRLEGVNLGSSGQQQMQQGSQVGSNFMQPQQTGKSVGQQNSNPLILGPSKERRKENAEAFKSTHEYRSKILESRRNARNELKDLGRLEELSASGKLDTPGYVAFLEKSGLDIPSLMSPESQEFAKIQQGFLKNAKQIFGGRVSNYEVEQFLKTVPSLSQSPEGRQRVIAGLKHLARGNEEYYKAYDEVLKENKGVPPLDIEERVEQKADKRMGAIAQQFKKDLSKPVPKGQNKLITALQSGAGTLVGNIPGALKGAGKGALAGYGIGKFGGPGTAAGGAALGALGGLAGII